ncbi:astacin [Ancylostoma caninum]|uniref:Metalloendopeptidase n=1 Tax=Ancylostoma caninum TaxID=29170 RepID=A0A368GV62_ANCCA|nr:astacin [Ancylostoma caninum]
MGNLRHKRRGSIEGLYIDTTYNGLCASKIGKVKEDRWDWEYWKWQNLYLGKGCETFGRAAHELGHALGLAHTMSRRDRGKYIIVDTINMKPEYASQFKTNESLENYGLGYDYGSIMHYRQGSGYSKGEYVMILPDSKYKNTLGSEMISFIDLTMINRHYNCTGKI